jgi:hypothetical protein
VVTGELLRAWLQRLSHASTVSATTAHACVLLVNELWYRHLLMLLQHKRSRTCLANSSAAILQQATLQQWDESASSAPSFHCRL